MNENNNTEPVVYAVGTRGYSAYEVAVQNGFIGTEQEWLDSLVGPQGPQGQPFDELTPEQKAEITGAEGKSAYEVAVEEGYEGTEEDFVNSYINADNYYNKQQVDTKTNKLTSDLNDEITTRQNNVTNLQSQISGLASGSPLVASSTAEMTDTTRIYVNTTDGKWYYYDGDSWEIGGTYQATALDDEEVSIKNLDSNFKEINEIYIPEIDDIISSKYVDSVGMIYDNSGFTIIKCKLPAYSTVFFKAKGYLTNVAMISLQSKVGSSKAQPLDISINGDINVYKYTNNTNIDIEIYLSYLTSDGYELYISKNTKINYESQILFNNLILNENATDDKYLSENGDIYTSDGYKLSDYFEIIDYLNYSIVSNYSLNVNVDDIAIGFYDINKNFISGIKYTKNNYLELNIPQNSKYFRVTLAKMQLTNIVVNRNMSINYLYNMVNSNKKNKINSTMGIVSNAVFIGDSLTKGETYISDTSPKFYNNYYNYPYFMKKIMQIDTIKEMAFGGATTTSWWNYNENNIIDTNSLYFVWLGTNDIFTDTVATDCAGNDYTQYANTETGIFGKILGKIKSLNGNRIVLINNFTTNGNLILHNKVINDLAQKFDCVVIDINSSDCKNQKYHLAYNGHYNGVHFNSKGHNYVANYINNSLNEYLSDNQFEFYKIQ